MSKTIVEEMNVAAELNRQDMIDRAVVQQCVMTAETLPQRRLDYVFGKVITKGLLTVVGAPGGMSKSTFMASVSLSMATGKPLLGQTAVEGRVLHLGIEDDQDTNTRMFKASIQRHGLATADMADRVTVMGQQKCRQVLKMGDHEGIALIRYEQDVQALQVDETMVTKLEELIRDFDCVVIDPLAVLYGGLKMTNEAMNLIARTLANIAMRLHVAIVLVSHTRKDSGNKRGYTPSQDDIKFGSELVDTARAAVVITKPSGKQIEAWRERDPDQDYSMMREVTVVKTNVGPVGLLLRYRIVLESVNHADGTTMESAAVLPWSPPADCLPAWMTNDFYDNLQALLERKFIKAAPNAGADGLWRVMADLLDIDDKAAKKAAATVIKAGWVAVEKQFQPEDRKDRKRAVRGKSAPNKPELAQYRLAEGGIFS